MRLSIFLIFLFHWVPGWRQDYSELAKQTQFIQHANPNSTLEIDTWWISLKAESIRYVQMQQIQK
jgi:hypothetical protein